MDTNFTGSPPRRPVPVLPAQQRLSEHRSAAHGLRRCCDRNIALDALGLRLSRAAASRTASRSTAPSSIGAGFDDGRGHVVAYFGYRKINAGPAGRARLQRLHAAIVGRRHSASPAAVRGGSGDGELRHRPVLRTTPGADQHVDDLAASGREPDPGAWLHPVQLRAVQLLPASGRALHRAAPSPNYEISPAIKPYMEFMFMDDHTLAQIAPSGDFGNTLTINCDNPLMRGTCSGDHLRSRAT